MTGLGVIPIIIGRPDTESILTRNTTQTMKLTEHYTTMKSGATNNSRLWPHHGLQCAGAERLQSARKCLNTNTGTLTVTVTHPLTLPPTPRGDTALTGTVAQILLIIKSALRERGLLSSAWTKDNAEVPGGCVSNCQ